MSWGNKLVIVFLAFAGLMATLVYNAMTTKFELVTKDYYKEELRFQEKIDGAANAGAAGRISLLQEHSTITLQLPVALTAATVEGEAWFYCKTNAGNDRKFAVRTEDGKYVFDKSKLEKANYDLKLTVASGGKQYYFTEPVTIK